MLLGIHQSLDVLKQEGIKDMKRGINIILKTIYRISNNVDVYSKAMISTFFFLIM